MELTYTQCGDYLIPNLVLSDTKEYTHRQIWPDAPCLSERPPSGPLTVPCCLQKSSFPHLTEIDAACKNRLEIIEAEMMRREGVTEALKADNQMEWVRRMNSIHSRAERNRPA